jgi:hypothetical protein
VREGSQHRLELLCVVELAASPVYERNLAACNGVLSSLTRYARYEISPLATRNLNAFSQAALYAWERYLFEPVSLLRAINDHCTHSTAVESQRSFTFTNDLKVITVAAVALANHMLLCFDSQYCQRCSASCIRCYTTSCTLANVA